MVPVFRMAGADLICQTRAQSATSLAAPGTYKAWLSSSTAWPADGTRFTQATVPYRLVDGTQIAADWAQLILFLDAPIGLDETASLAILSYGQAPCLTAPPRTSSTIVPTGRRQRARAPLALQPRRMMDGRRVSVAMYAAVWPVIVCTVSSSSGVDASRVQPEAT
jgi:hypothetical protein